LKQEVTLAVWPLHLQRNHDHGLLGYLENQEWHHFSQWDRQSGGLEKIFQGRAWLLYQSQTSHEGPPFLLGEIALLNDFFFLFLWASMPCMHICFCPCMFFPSRL
jgi:hypothetical protein